MFEIKLVSSHTHTHSLVVFDKKTARRRLFSLIVSSLIPPLNDKYFIYLRTVRFIRILSALELPRVLGSRKENKQGEKMAI